MRHLRLLLFFALLVLTNCHKSSYDLLTQTINKNKLTYQIAGKNNCIVFIHGGGLDRHMWSPQFKALKKEFKIITYDLRGHGDSDAVTNSHPEIEDLHQLLEVQNISSVYLVGQSLGAVIAQDFVINYPQLVEKLVLVSPGIIGLNQPQPELIDVLANYSNYLENKDMIGAITSLTQLSFYGLRTISDIDTNIENYVREAHEKFILSDLHFRAPQLKTDEPINELNKIKIPVLILHGDKDYKYVGDNVAKLASEIPNSIVKEIKNSGHLINLEQPKEFNAILLNFLK